MSAANWARLSVLLVLALVFQVTVLDQVVVFGAHPDVMVLLPAAAGLVGGPQRGAVVGFVTGLVADLVVNLPYGLSALCFTLLGFAVGLLLAIPAGREFTSAQIGACMVAAAVGTAGYALLAELVHQRGVLSHSTVSAVLVVSVGALVLGYPAILAMRWVLGGSTNPTFIPSGGSATA
jgi:rod shape-determining protein MreD